VKSLGVLWSWWFDYFFKDAPAFFSKMMKNSGNKDHNGD
jgi:hypothetical protein